MAGQRGRLCSIDILRGMVMVLMALDHVRDYLSASAGVFEPTDLTRTSAALFFTRWVTHFCAPIFVVLAGLGAGLAGQRGKSASELAGFLATRGLRLIFLEICVISPLGWSFQLNWAFVRLQVIWVIGLSMLVLSVLVVARVSARVVGLAGLAMIVGHNALDGFGAGWWKLLHAMTFHRIGSGHVVASLYPLIPWVGVMMVGYGLGELWTWESARRRRWLLSAGVTSLVAFVVLRGLNVYGDPNPWKPEFGVLSFINFWKYPPSLDYLSATVGVGLLLLAALEGATDLWTRPFETLGGVPLFYYLLHIPLIHGVAIGLAMVQYGRAEWLWQDPFALRRTAPAGYGFELPMLYLIWLFVVLALYPLCRWYGDLKRRKAYAWCAYV